MLLGAPLSAQANEFVINACQADRAEFSTRAFEDFANRGMMWKRACDPEGPGLRGLVTANVVRAGRVEQGARSLFILRAPEGTQFARFTWSGQARRRDCRYALQVWAARTEGVTRTIKNVRANTGCPPQGRMQAAGWPRPHTYDVSGATAIVQRVMCVGSAKTPYCSARTLNYIRTFKAQATVVDVSAPAVAVQQDTPFTRGEWVSGTQQVNYVALDNVGVAVARAIVGGRRAEEHTRPCNYAERVPCVNGVGGIGVDTSRLPEGSQPLAVQAVDAAGNAGDSAAVSVRIDNTAPGAVPVSLEGGEAWRNQNRFDVSWADPGEADRAPIVAAHLRLCSTEGSPCVDDTRLLSGVSALSGLSVPEPGEWQLRLWRQDAAGNQEPANASVPVVFRYDPEPPVLGFEDSVPSDPTLVSVRVTDDASGLAEGQIELSREGSNIWEALPTVQSGDHLTARVDDARLPPGSYSLRATAIDRAANQNSTGLRLDGRPMTLTLPARTPTVVDAGVVSTRVIRRTRGRGHSRRPVDRHDTVLLPRARLRVGREFTVAGQLRSHTGIPLGGADVEILSRTSASPEAQVATFRTDARGRFRYTSRANASSVLRIAYAGSATTLPAQREVAVLVPAGSTMRARPTRVLNGESVTFAGRLRSQPAPAAGKLVELQVVLSGRWQTFKTIRTSASGTWRASYRFRRSCGRLRYRFRARLPAESGYPFESGASRGVSVLVRGRPCN